MTAVATPRAPRLADIQAAVCRQYRIRPADLLGPSRRRTISRPRQIAMYLATRLTHRSIPDIGRFFGGRDHSTVYHARDRISALAEADRDLAEIVGRLELRLRELATNPPCHCSDCRSGSRAFPLDPPQIPLPIAFPGELDLEVAA
ncbi:helix-turn-helix domain-containing protein [Sphingomonas sp.]|uniref:helix-turn-helix domain-containing protein n=1 Tax=Sphingomonas sp. TaxID=28214 RepID=UPI000DB57B6C|nr:helix-turn-helix domain-containing protein [Sphingomonas sp.]PZU10037.1 MAG: hypothetical protein DI605_05400 [Sphingomonas sp.]